MVCVLEEGSALCIIQDLTTTATTGTKSTLSLPASTTVQELFQEVGRKFQYDPDHFELILQRTSDGESIILNEHKSQTLDTVGVNFDAGARNLFLITDMLIAPRRRRKVVALAGEGEDDMLLGASASPTASTDYAHPPPAPPPPPPVVSSGDYSYASALIKQDTGYVGLVNQAMTCYLNSLLQALYMTPEFRNALYKWIYDGTETDAVKSIPYQLQKLFLNLQTSCKSAVETTELTRSFGWDSSEAWQQHDIQELCRVMFDALEQKFKDTEQSDLILRLYEGKMIDYVKCLECGTEKQREDTFLDIPLPVRPFGSSVAYGSVEEALRAFVQPETLDGNNQYHCEKCNKKCDAHKGLKFSKFPYLLTLHLKRFDFDYTTLHRIKLNDKVTFPEILNLNSFVVNVGNKEENESVPEESVVKCDDSSTTDSGSALDDESCQGTETALSTQDADYQEDDEGIDMSNGPNHHENEKNRRHTMEKGPYMYELFSIMIHSGSASGGHYYAYIKDFKKGEWFCFNDQSVSRITYDDIQKTYGGGPARSYYSGAYSSSTNAYMLMYRQIDKQKNCEAMSVDQFPSHIKELLQKLKSHEETILREKEMDTCKIKVYCHHPVKNQLVESKLYGLNVTTLQEATELAYRNFKLAGIVPLERCRLVNYDKLQETIECSFDGRDDEPIGDIMNSLRGTYKHDLLLEIRKEDAEWESYQPGGVATKVFVVNVETEEVDGPTIVRGNLSQTVKEFKGTLAKALSLDAKNIKIVLEKYSNEPRLLDNDEKTLKLEGFYGSNKIFVASSCDEDPEKPFAISKLHKIIDRFEHIISLNVVLPETDKETLEKLAIPALNLDVNHNGNANFKNNEENSTNDEGAAAVTLSATTATVTATVTITSSSTSGAGDGASALVVSSSANPQRESSPQPLGDVEDEGIGATGHSDQSASEDSSLTDSDRTLVGDVPDECLAQLSSPSNSPPGSDQHNISSPEENHTNTYHSFVKEQQNISSPDTHSHTCRFYKDDGMVWNDEEIHMASATTRATNYYFKAVPYADNEKMLKVLVDKRMILATLKKDLEPYVGVPLEYFKIYRLYTGQQEFECARLLESLGSYRDDEKLIIKLGRALRKGEHRGKVYQLLPNSTEPSKYLCDWILGKGMTVGEAKKEILEELVRKYAIDIPHDRCRLRKKSWKNPAKVYLDEQKFEDEISLFPNWEMFLQELPEPEKVTSNQLVLFVRRWCPSTLELKPFEEVVLDNSTVEELKDKLSELSGIPVENVEFAKGQGSFPCDMSVLAVHTDLDWNTQTKTLDSWPLNIFEDGHVILYRDSREEVKQLSSEERKEIASKEGSRVNRLSGTTSTISPRKERALKIYLDSSPKKNEDDLD